MMQVWRTVSSFVGTDKCLICLHKCHVSFQVCTQLPAFFIFRSGLSDTLICEGSLYSHTHCYENPRSNNDSYKLSWQLYEDEAGPSCKFNVFKIFPVFCTTERLMTTPTKARRWSLSWAKWIQSTALREPSVCPMHAQVSQVLSSSRLLMRATYPAHPVLINCWS
jgi:hypothetical protein